MSSKKHHSKAKKEDGDKVQKSIPEIRDREDLIEAEVAEVIEDLPVKKKDIILRAMRVRHQSGPLPDGETIRIYNEVIPDGGDRLMKTVEKQLEHRIAIEKIGMERSFNQSSTGQWFGFAIALVFGIIAWDLAKSGYEISATILGAFDLIALVTVFVTGNGKK
ncbi:DUF2335 domain-containing protein [Zobellia sp. 1_MG-2023]|uniref:DUF2335 domain-containing protein n=1 Tax=Zobellia sp. 1_MG-2023 TaxID=3062626 RepID=UPI0026E1ECEA|nr:DUF2335 domain-containing protein [Zobellia sp. 1_MG-2023]MDO6818680.1 DUF2335 domain-containing protein [Zobellia sp. 1_MG-2023]